MEFHGAVESCCHPSALTHLAEVAVSSCASPAADSATNQEPVMVWEECAGQLLLCSTGIRQSWLLLPCDRCLQHPSAHWNLAFDAAVPVSPLLSPSE